MPQTQKSVFSSRMFTIFFWGSLGYSILLILNSVIRIFAYREVYEFLGEKDQNLSLDYVAAAFMTLWYEFYYSMLFWIGIFTIVFIVRQIIAKIRKQFCLKTFFYALIWLVCITGCLVSLHIFRLGVLKVIDYMFSPQ